MGTEENDGRGRGAVAAVLLFAMVPILYVVLLGPAVRYYDDLPRPVQFGLEVVYWPLEWLHGKTPLMKPLDDYVEWWTRD